MLRHSVRFRSSATVLPLAGMVAIGLVALGGVPGDSDQAVLHASGDVTYDYDLDGLSNHFEDLIGSSPYMSDTDQDGFSDLEEFARGSDPSDPQGVPLPGNISLNMSASGEVDGVHLQTATYFTDGDPENKDLQVGLVINGEARLLPGFLDLPGVEVTRWEDSSGHGAMLMVNAPFPESIVHTYGQVSVFTMLTVQPAPAVVGAAAVDLASIDGIVGIVQETPVTRWNAYISQAPSGGSAGGPLSGSIYTPIPTGDGSVPGDWSPGEVCFQATVDISIEAGIILREVVGAGCISGGGACPPTCSSSVGNVFQTFDPMGLIGG